MANRSPLKKHRLFYILLLMTVLLIGLNVRLFWIQVAASRNFTDRSIDLVENSVIQREQGIVLDSGRGDFYDRNGVALTGSVKTVLTVFPVKEHFPENNLQLRQQIAQILHVSERQWQTFVESLKSPAVWTANGKPVQLTEAQIGQIEALGLPQLAVTRYKQRYDAEQLASQVIGFISQDPQRITRQFTDQIHKGELQLTSKIGGAGLEKTFEPWLQGLGPTSLSLFTDGLKRPLAGLAARTVFPDNSYYPLKVITTLDASIQRRVELVMDKLHIQEGAVVVMDAANADVIAMASRPEFHPEHVDLKQGSWSNKAVKGTAPGSIFKTVTAAAALEEGLVRPGETFDCRGELGKYGLSCWKQGGHGHITFEEGYAQSCNIVFAEIAERLDGVKLEEYAHKLGLDVRVGWSGRFMQEESFRQWDSEDKGQVYAGATPKQDGGVKAQTSIGQRDVLVTPLQAANMIVTLLSGGEVASPRIVKEIRFGNGRLMEELPAHRVEGLPASLSPGTSKTLLSWMEEVVDHGTGSGLQSAHWKVAGKSGTAQVRDKQGRDKVNQWFIGYGPAEMPRYAVAVLVQNATPDEKSISVPLFRQVMDVLAEQPAKGAND
ncbi:Penicillin-binding protein 4B [Paenibacillus konkukensis]|uniref:Penicillin-binding protein 4B n=1 Tax=Paenibacillus konkukensis TaxID=2020716 RepID=A0ABY4RJY3_9BACL|nr:penicillin-binding transpeptidase domain-containing protein [Paenibacillus konkukensis]UQZ82532.1 Penicillin-binding protein 4B [Paenibacillus konkukensis]